MNMMLLAAVLAVVLAISETKSCTEQADCGPKECCVGYMPFRGMCRASTKAGRWCRPKEPIFPYPLDYEIYIMACPCAEDLECVAEKGKSEDGVCRKPEPPATEAPATKEAQEETTTPQPVTQTKQPDVKPTDQEQPDEPAQTDAPVEPEEPVQTDAPVEPAEPVQTDAPIKPEEPVQTDAPVEPAEPVQTDAPIQPEEPFQTDSPIQPEEPVQTDVPVQPEEPVQTDAPVQPEEPVQTDVPVQPEEPVQTYVPVQPVEPSEPEVPAQPEEPVQPEEPSEPEVPVQPEEPAQPEGQIFYIARSPEHRRR